MRHFFLILFLLFFQNVANASIQGFDLGPLDHQDAGFAENRLGLMEQRIKKSIQFLAAERHGKKVPLNLLRTMALSWANWMIGGGASIVLKRVSPDFALDLTLELSETLNMTGEFYTMDTLLDQTMMNFSDSIHEPSPTPNSMGFTKQDRIIFDYCESYSYLGLYNECERTIKRFSRGDSLWPNFVSLTSKVNAGKIVEAERSAKSLMAKIPKDHLMKGWLYLMLTHIYTIRGSLREAKGYFSRYQKTIDPAFMSDLRDSIYAIMANLRILRLEGDYAEAWRLIDKKCNEFDSVYEGPFFPRVRLEYEALLTALSERNKARIEDSVVYLTKGLKGRSARDFYTLALRIIKMEIHHEDWMPLMRELKEIRPSGSIDFYYLNRALESYRNGQ